MANKRSKQKINVLPFDIEDEILARVTVKDLLRFRSVCKRWAFLFKNKKFITNHMSFARRKFLLVPDRHHPPCSIVYKQDRNPKPKMIMEKHDLTAGDKDLIGIEILDHCNGLFCIQLQNETFAVWNPSLRELKKIPISLLPNAPLHMGFGYDDTIDDYKIIVLHLKFPSATIPKNEVEIFRLKSNPRVIDYPIDAISLVWSRTRLGKNIFWLVRVMYDRRRQQDRILCFDIVSETFEEVSFPCLDNESSYMMFRDLQVVRKRLCLVETLNHEADDKIVIWAADHDRGINYTMPWIKWFTIPIANIGIPQEGISLSTPLERCCDNDDKELLIIIFKSWGRTWPLSSYNVEKNTFTTVETNFPVCGYGFVEVDGDGDDDDDDDDALQEVWHDMYEYVETMFSLSSYLY